MNKTISAYLAGIIDGEGSICIVRKFGPRSKNPSFLIRISVGMSCLQIIEFLQENFRGSIHKEKKKLNRKQMYRWNIQGNKAANFLEAIRPFLIEKKEKAKIAMEFYGLHTKMLKLPVKERNNLRKKEEKYKQIIQYGNQTDKF